MKYFYIAALLGIVNMKDVQALEAEKHKIYERLKKSLDFKSEINFKTSITE